MWHGTDYGHGFCFLRAVLKFKSPSDGSHKQDCIKTLYPSAHNQPPPATSPLYYLLWQSKGGLNLTPIPHWYFLYRVVWWQIGSEQAVLKGGYVEQR